MSATTMLNISPSQAAPDSHLIACRDAHLSGLDPKNTWNAIRQTGFTGVEVWVNPDRTLPYLNAPDRQYNLKSAESIEQLAQDLKEQNIAITAFAMPNQFDERLEEELLWVKDVVQACKTLNVPAIRIDVVPRAIKEQDKFLEFAISTCRELAKMVNDTSIHFGIENHGSTTNDPDFLDPLFEAVDPAIGLTLDTGNFYWWGHPLDNLYEIYEKYASRVYHTHCKSINYPEDRRNTKRPRGWEYGKYASPIYSGDIDFDRVFKILLSAGYENDFCIENESLGRFPESERSDILRKEASTLRNLLKTNQG